MSCPNWQELAAWRDDSQAGEPAEWREALVHLDRGCALCRRAAYAADPTLVFRRLAAPGGRLVPEPTPAQESSDVDAMRRAVAAMRAASRVEAVERKGLAGNWKRWAAAAALAVAALSVPADDPRHLPRRAALVIPASFSPSEAGEAAAVLPASFGDDQPILEGVNLPDARFYHMEGEGLSVVMVVDETMGV